MLAAISLSNLKPHKAFPPFYGPRQRRTLALTIHYNCTTWENETIYTF